jgi:hypothetical protein
MKRSALGLSLALLLLVLGACAGLQPTPTATSAPDRIATGVAEAMAVAATLTARAPTDTATPAPAATFTQSPTATATSAPTLTATPRPTATPTPNRYLGYRFHVLEGSNPTNEQLVDKLWSTPGLAFRDLQLPQGPYILGIERDVTEADLPYIDRSYTMPWGGKDVIVLPVDVYYTVKDRRVFDGGLFLPSEQSDLVSGGLMRWVWDKEISVDPYGGGNMAMGLSVPKDAPYQDTLVPPLLRADKSESELQVAVVKGDPVLIRKVFVLSGPDLRGVQFDLETHNTDHIFPFAAGPNEVSAAEHASPDLQFEIKGGDSREGLVANFNHTKSIRTSFLRCQPLDNAPPFLHVKYHLVGWNGPKVEMTVDLVADAGAPVGTHYFRIITECHWDGDPFRKERIVSVKVTQ